MKRTPIIRRTPLKRSQKPIPKQSKSPVRAERMRLYEIAKDEARLELLTAQGLSMFDIPRCQWPGCKGDAVDPHHTHGRRGTNLYDKSKIKFLCRRHHNQTHHDPKAARALGLIA